MDYWDAFCVEVDNTGGGVQGKGIVDSVTEVTWGTKTLKLRENFYREMQGACQESVKATCYMSLAWSIQRQETV